MIVEIECVLTMGQNGQKPVQWATVELHEEMTWPELAQEVGMRFDDELEVYKTIHT
jgi:hypothetical protein